MKYLRSADANADHTTIIVFKADTFSDSGWNHLIYTEGGFVGFLFNDDKIKYYNWDEDTTVGGGRSEYANLTFNSTSRTIAAFNSNGAQISTKLNGYMDSISTNSGPTEGINDQVIKNDGRTNTLFMTLGASTVDKTTTHDFDGQISEILIFDKVLSESEYAKVNNYLAKKWNLTTVDSDNDGFTDAVEITNGSIATDSSSTPAGIPAVIADAKLWLDASNINAQSNAGLDSGDAISTWMDLSGNGYNMTSPSNSNPSLNDEDGIQTIDLILQINT